MLKPDEFRFEKINVDARLSSPIVKCAVQDKQGFIWFGTPWGLSRYDGYTFKKYETIQNFSSVLDLHITTCFKDSTGNLWFGALSGIILEYDYSNDQLIKFEINLSNRFPSREIYVTSICEDADGYLWISTLGKGLYKFDKVSKSSCAKRYDKNCAERFKDFIRGLSITDNNELIISYGVGIDVLNLKNESFQSITVKDTDTNLEFYRPCRFRNSKYFVGSNSGIKIINLRSREISDYEIFSLKGKHVNPMCIDKSDNLWISVYNEGLIYINLKSKYQKFFSGDSDDSPRSFYFTPFLYRDNSNILWVCTAGSGIYKLDVLTKRSHNLNRDIDILRDLRTVRDLKTDHENNIWIVSSFNYLVKFDAQRKIFKEYYLFDNNGNIVNSESRKIIYEDVKKDLWIGTQDDGLFKYDKEKDVIVKYDKVKIEEGFFRIITISEYYEDETHYLLLGSSKLGITCINLRNETVSEFSELHKLEPNIKDDIVHRMFLDNEKNLWVRLLNLRGLLKISMSKSLLEYYHLNLTKNVDVFKIYEDSLNNLWFCTSDGLYKLTKYNKLISQFTSIDGLPSDIVFSIIEDNRNEFWVVTSKAISKFNSQTNNFKNYDCHNRITNEILLGACCKDDRGTLYFGGFDGIDYFDPDEFIDNSYIPNIVITDFQINNKSVIASSKNTVLSENINYAKEINISYKENIFSFEFAALVFNNPQQNQYAYKMEGFDKDWVYCGTRRTASYTNLDPGEYVFRVKGSNNDDVWNEEGTSIKITITPPYWKTWWFKGLGMLSMAAATGLTYKNRLDKIEKERKDQEEFSRKLIESQENERKRIASELHDTIAHEVLIAKNKADIGLKHLGEMDKVENTLKEISELSSATIKDVRNISYNLHPHQLERLGFTKTIRAIVNDVSKSTDIDFSFESDTIDGHLTKESEINLFRVIQESINNMIKHSDADKAEVKLLVSDDYILVILKDNGKGISGDHKNLSETKGGFGLSGMKERIKYMKGEIHIESEENKGTSIIIRIPVKV